MHKILLFYFFLFFVASKSLRYVYFLIIVRTNKESLALKELIEAISRRRETSSHDFVMLMCQGIGGTNNIILWNGSFRDYSRTLFLFVLLFQVLEIFYLFALFFERWRNYRGISRTRISTKEKGKEVEEILVEFCKICFTNTLIQYSLKISFTLDLYTKIVLAFDGRLFMFTPTLLLENQSSLK